MSGRGCPKRPQTCPELPRADLRTSQGIPAKKAKLTLVDFGAVRVEVKEIKAARANIKNFASWLKLLYFGNSQRMQHMSQIEFINIFPRNHVYLLVPIFVQVLQL